MKKLLIIFITIFILKKSTFAQTQKIETIKAAFKIAKNEEQKLNSLLKLAEEYQSVNRDSFNVYIDEIKRLAQKSNNLNNQYLSIYINAANYFRWGWADSARYIIEPVLKKIPKNNPKSRSIYFNALRLKAMCFGSKSQFKESLATHLQLAKEAELGADSLFMGLSYNSIGSVNMALGEFENAKTWIAKAIKIGEKKAINPSVLAPAYLNFANYFLVNEKLDSANYYLKKALPLSKQIENLNYISTGLRIQSKINMNQGQYMQAEKALLDMFEIRKKLDGSSSLIEDNLQMAEFYAQTKQYQKAINLCLENLKTGDLYQNDVKKSQTLNNAINNRLAYVEALAKYYKLAGQNQNYQNTLEQFIAMKDSFITSNSKTEIAELQTKYEVEKKEKTIAEQKLNLTIKNYWLYGSSIFSFLLATIGWLVFKNYRRKQNYKLKKALEEEKQIAAQSILNAEEHERKRIAADLHDNIGAYATAIRADVEKINDNGIENSAGFLHNLQQHSDEIIGSLRDTIWVLNKENITITSISDRLKNYVNKLQPSYENITIQINEEIENDRKISSQNALNIFRIMQEAIHNALKHSKANNLTINILSKENLNISVVDNGIGLNENNITRGEGLNNMQMRAKEIGLDLSINSNENNGTTLALKSNVSSVF